ncbi:MAG: DUF4398 domain-containing protein [Deltaproteobacteria bacterium]|nr:DUF4398 domain-containing protein [Deltaproteobacteria bacterium]
MLQTRLMAVVLLTSVFGCAAARPSGEQMNQAISAIHDAEQADAVSMAPVPMRTAREAYAKAEEAVRQQEELEASRLADQATVDAKLASATARATRAERSLDEMRRSQDALRQEGSR